MKKEIGIIGLGKMGMGVALHAKEKGWRVVGYNRSEDKTAEFVSAGGEGASSLGELVSSLSTPRVVWSMLPAGEATEEILLGEGGLLSLLAPNDVVIEAGNAFYEDSVRRGNAFAEKGIAFVDVGYSGGPAGARRDGCLMVGGDEKTVRTLAPLFDDLASEKGGWLHCGATGAGHFVKMVHNGIEYGMMQSLAEGFAILKAAPFSLNLTKIAHLYNTRSVIESRLVEWLERGLSEYGEDLEGISGTVAHTGEGKWTVEVAKTLGVPAPSIALAYQFRVESSEKPSYIGKILSTLRNQFGGHRAI